MSVFERRDFSPEWNQLCPEWYMDPDAPAPVGRWQFYAHKHEGSCGETIIVKAKFFEHDSIVIGADATVAVTPEFAPAEEFRTKTSATGIEIPVTMAKPGFVRISVAANGTTQSYGIGFDIRNIQPAPEVEGFDAYWEKQLKRLAEVPADVLECSPLSFPDYPGTESYNVRIRSIDDIPVSGILSIPENAQPGSLPAYLFLQGAGCRPPFPPLPWAKSGFLAFNISALGVRYGQGEEYEQEQKKIWENYTQVRSADPEKVPFNSMAMRVIRALEYLKSRPEWDRKTLIVHGGSQGGWQSLVASAFDPDITYLQIEAPANCNLLGALEGRKVVWPCTVKPEEGMSPENRTAGFFDGATFGRRAKAPAVFTVGYSDAAATPSSVCATYNVYGGKCHLWSFPDHGHETAVFFSGEKLILEAAGK